MTFIRTKSTNTSEVNIESISVNTIPQTPDVNKNVDITVPEEVSDLTDTSISTVEDNQVLSYNATSEKWENKNTLDTIEDGSIERTKLHEDVTDELDTDRTDIDSNKEDIDNLKDLISSLSNQQPADQGDIAIVPLLTGDADANIWRKRNTKDSEGNYLDQNTGGYAFTSSKFTILNKMFNRIKVNVYTPGWVRIGIIRATGTNEFDGVARGFCRAGGYDLDSEDVYPINLIPGNDGSDTTCDGQSHKMLRKWLVCQWVASPGVHVFDIPDTIITSPCEYIYCEDRTGISGFAMNRSGEAIVVDGLSIPNGTVPNGVSWPTTYISTTNFNNGSYAVSRNMLDASADIVYHAYTGGPKYASWMSIDTTQAAEDRAFIRQFTGGWLNIGLYQRGSSGTISHAPVVENAISQSETFPNTRTLTNAITAWIPYKEGQAKLAEQGKEIYAIDLIVTTPGELTMYKLKGDTSETAEFITAYTLVLRAVGRQTIHLPEPIILQEGEYLGFGGVTQAALEFNGDVSTLISDGKFKQGYVDTAKFAYTANNGAFDVLNWSCFGDDPTGIQNSRPPFSGVTGKLGAGGFDRWENVQLVGGTKKLDFTNATYERREGLPAYTVQWLNISLIARSGKHCKLEDKLVSITGDSISTYLGTISKTTDFGVTTNAAGDNAVFYPTLASGAVNSPDQTWWGVLIKDNRASLIRNDAWSGSQVGGTDSTTSSTACASQIRTSMLNCTTQITTPNTTTGLRHPFGNPEVIFCMIGTNDLAGNRTVGAYSNTAPADISTLLGAFQTMIARHKIKYPYAKLVYFILPRGTTAPYPYTNALGLSISQLALSMEYIAHAMGAHFVPLNYFEGIDRPDASEISFWTSTTGYTHPRSYQIFGTTDRLHPNIVGNQLIANGLTRYVEENF